MTDTYPQRHHPNKERKSPIRVQDHQNTLSPEPSVYRRAIERAKDLQNSLSPVSAVYRRAIDIVNEARKPTEEIEHVLAKHRLKAIYLRKRPMLNRKPLRSTNQDLIRLNKSFDSNLQFSE